MAEEKSISERKTFIMNELKKTKTADKPLRMDPAQAFQFKCGPEVPCFTD
jgi:hypothetical protein